MRFQAVDTLLSRSFMFCSENVSAPSPTDLTDIQWIQASLPVKNGGLGVRRVSSLAPSAFLASAVGIHDLQELILAKCDAVVDSAVNLIMVQWIITHGQPAVSYPNGPRVTDRWQPSNVNGTSPA